MWEITLIVFWVFVFVISAINQYRYETGWLVSGNCHR